MLKTFQSECISPDTEDITASSNWKALHVFAVIWIFSVLEKLQSFVW